MPFRGADVDSLSSSLPSSAPGSAPGTPKLRVKFLCSHGGKILPRPADGHLKYVGGETRVICVPRDISITELMKKLTSMFDGEMILKYQLIPEDFDILVTVKSDEDLRHMIEECDRHELLGAPRLRAFLFSANPIVMENQMGPMDHHSLEQRYINSVNGIVVHPSPIYRPLPINTSYTTFSISSACSSPRTPPETTTTATSGINHDFTTPHGSLSRNHSSPSLCNLYCNSPNNHQITSPNWNQSQQQSPSNHHHHHHQPPPQTHHYHPQPQPNHSPKPPLDRHTHKSSGADQHIGRTRSMGVGDYYRTTNKGGGGHVSYQRGSPYDDYYGSFRYERNESPPGSPLARSPNGVSPSPSVRSGRS